MTEADIPPAISVVGRKNSGKTTLVVALAAELKRRGLRVASIKHGHHRFEIDQPGRDSWRHFHEGEVEAVLLASAGKLALIERQPEEPEPEALLRRFFAGRGYDVVLVEGYKQGPFPRIEVFRRAVQSDPLFDPTDGSARLFLALVTDDPAHAAGIPVIPLDPAGAHVRAVADLVCSHLALGRGDA